MNITLRDNLSNTIVNNHKRNRKYNSFIKKFSPYYNITKNCQRKTMMFSFSSSLSLLALFLFSFTIFYENDNVVLASNNNNSPYELPLPSYLDPIPSYSIRIPFTGFADSSAYYPQVISIPVGMSVIWYNDDVRPHTVTTLENAPEEFNFTIIPPGGFADFTFTKPGIYDYYDKMFPSVKGRIIVGDLIEIGENITMRIGGNIPFNYTELQRIVFSIIPNNIILPSNITYSITIIKSPADRIGDNIIYKQQFNDTDGILDLEIIPVTQIGLIPEPIENNGGYNINVFDNKNITSLNFNTKENSINISKSTISTITYGPDISKPITGTFHIQGPILVEPTHYYIQIDIKAINGKVLNEAITEEFLIPTIVE
jgi:hypothetical protein